MHSPFGLVPSLKERSAQVLSPRFSSPSFSVAPESFIPKVAKRPWSSSMFFPFHLLLSQPIFLRPPPFCLSLHCRSSFFFPFLGRRGHIDHSWRDLGPCELSGLKILVSQAASSSLRNRPPTAIILFTRPFVVRLPLRC